MNTMPPEVEKLLLNKQYERLSHSSLSVWRVSEVKGDVVPGSGGGAWTMVLL